MQGGGGHGGAGAGGSAGGSGSGALGGGAQQGGAWGSELPAAGGTWADYDTVFTNAKAGMGGVDKERVKKVVYEASKGSAFFKREQDKNAQTDQKIANLKTLEKKLTREELDEHDRAAAALVAKLEAKRDLSRSWLHVDMDAFYAACEARDDPSLNSRPFAIGGMGMLSTANYEARKFGVRSAMPGFIAIKLCPHLHFIPGDMSKYAAAARDVREVLKCFDPDFLSGGLDEAYLDITDYCATRGVSPAAAAEELRRQMREATRLTCSAGVAPNRMLAKVCSDLNKPDGQFILSPTRKAVLEFVSSLPVRKVSGIGRVSERVLNAFGINVCGDLLKHKALLGALFTPGGAAGFLEVGLGLGATGKPTQEEVGVGRKGISHERTFRATSSRKGLESMVGKLVSMLAADMAAEGLRARTLTLKIKTTAFEVRTRASTFTGYVSQSEEILPVALGLLRAELPLELRLIGVRMSHFEGRPEVAPGQKTIESLFDRSKPPSASGAGGGGKEEALEWTPPPSPRGGGGGPGRGQRMEPALGYFGPPGPRHVSIGWEDIAAAKSEAGRGEVRGGEDAAAEAEGGEPGKWPCARCTFLNSGLVPRCAMCDGPPPAPRGPPAPGRGGHGGRSAPGSPAALLQPGIQAFLTRGRGKGREQGRAAPAAPPAPAPTHGGPARAGPPPPEGAECGGAAEGEGSQPCTIGSLAEWADESQPAGTPSQPSQLPLSLDQWIDTQGTEGTARGGTQGTEGTARGGGGACAESPAVGSGEEECSGGHGAEAMLDLLGGTEDDGGGGGGGGGGGVPCPECGDVIPPHGESEHRDYHFALTLQGDGRARASPAKGSPGGKGAGVAGGRKRAGGGGTRGRAAKFARAGGAAPQSPGGEGAIEALLRRQAEGKMSAVFPNNAQ